MRRLCALIAVFLFLPLIGIIYTPSALSYTVTYSSSTPSSSTTTPAQPPICPANAILQGTQCFCVAGYKVSSNSCVKDEAMPPGTYEIYVDVATAVQLNDGKLSCEQLGLVAAIELDMCKRYLATPENKRDQWTSIQRPYTPPAGMITNPWAQPGQMQLDFLATTSTIPANIPAPPPPPPPPATTTPPLHTSTDETSGEHSVSQNVLATSEPAPETKTEAPDEAPAAALAKLQPTKFEENMAALKKGEELSPLKDEPTLAATTSPSSAPETQSPYASPLARIQVASAETSPNAVNMASVAAGLAPLRLHEEDMIPSGFIETTPPPEDRVSVVSKIFSWLFGWL
jgi:hypothetical protein